eukprot:19810_1
MIFRGVVFCLVTTSLIASQAVYAAPVTCGSLVKLRNVKSQHHLHSHEIKWGSGSGQQSVTAGKDDDDNNDFWEVHAKLGSQCAQATPIKCNGIFRLKHMETSQYLHTHDHRAPLSRLSEVSGFSPSDRGDDFRVICKSRSEFWERGQSVQLQNVQSDNYLYTNSRYEFNQGNCGRGCPIAGQFEVSCSPQSSVYTEWQTDQGIYFASQSPMDGHDEL